MGLKGLRFLGILIATYLLLFSEVAARELAEASFAREPGFANDGCAGSGGPGSCCRWGCCDWYSNNSCRCCPYSSQAGRQAKLP